MKRAFLTWMGVLLYGFSASASCLISAPSASSQRQIQVNVSCPGASFFKLSETPDFKESAATGVSVRITNVDPNSEFADISITYPNGGASKATPFSVPTTKKTPRVLAVLFDSGTGELGLPAYATPAWLNKLIFTGGHDGRGKYNSLKAYLEQNSYGAISLTGNVYPGVLHIDPLSTLRNTVGMADFSKAVTDKLVAQGYINPLNSGYDFLIAVSAGSVMATRPDFYTWSAPNTAFPGGNLIVDIPIDSTSPLYSDIVNEAAVVNAEGVVIPRFNAEQVRGVWLASDSAHLGQNYFSNVVFANQDSPKIYYNYWLRYIKLNQSMVPGTKLLVSYLPYVYRRISDATKNALPPDTFFSDQNGWFGGVAHEFMHSASGTASLLTPSTTKMPIADLYQVPWEITKEYDMMSTGNWNQAPAWNPFMNQSIRYNDPAHLNGHTKMQLGYFTPYTVGFGGNETNVRLYRSEEADFSSTSSRVKLIKVPLNPAGDKGFLQLVGYNGIATRKYAGDDYLILEWRTKGELTNGFNFDRAIPHEGLIIYRIVDGGPGPDPLYHGWDQTNVIQLQSATPVTFPVASLNDYTVKLQQVISGAPAPFGPASGIYQYVASEQWNWKMVDAVTADFLLTPQAGSKTIYAKFMDVQGNIIGTASAGVNFGGVATPLPTVAPTATPIPTLPPMVTPPPAPTLASISGSVFSSAGGVVSGAKLVVAKDGARKGVAYTSTSTGAYLVPNLVSGNYSLTFSARGFVSRQITLSVAAGASIRSDVTLTKK